MKKGVNSQELNAPHPCRRESQRRPKRGSMRFNRSLASGAGAAPKRSGAVAENATCASSRLFDWPHQKQLDVRPMPRCRGQCSAPSSPKPSKIQDRSVAIGPSSAPAKPWAHVVLAASRAPLFKSRGDWFRHGSAHGSALPQYPHELSHPGRMVRICARRNH